MAKWSPGKEALRSVVGDVLGLQMFSCSFHTSKIIASSSSLSSASPVMVTLLPCEHCFYKSCSKATTNENNM